MAARAQGKRSATKRDRYQLVVALGEGPNGAWRKRTLEEAAARAKKPTLSEWARSVLLREAGEPLRDEPPTRQEYEALERRLEWLEARFGKKGS